MNDINVGNVHASVLKVAIVGTGPAGMYCVEHLLTELGETVEIDLYERLPTPWGLVRSAVAPDHLIKKKIIDTCFTRLLNHKQVRFFGNVSVGYQVQHDELAAWYNAVIYASGAEDDARMNIPGEDLPGCVGARDFVHWYNGHPDFSNRDFDLSSKRAILIGNGNVAMDVARILTLHRDELEKSDMPDYAIEALRDNAIEEIVILGRRGHLQAAFHRPELEEFEHLEGVQVSVEGEELLPEDDPRCKELEWTTRKKLATLHRLADRKLNNPRKQIILHFLASPKEIFGNGKAQRLEVTRNELVADAAGKLGATPTDETFTLESGLILRAIGFRGLPFPGLPFDDHRNVMRNQSGRVTSLADDSEEESVLAGVYVTGWLKRGPRGLIGTNKMCARETIDCLLEDFSKSVLPSADLDTAGVLEAVRQRQPQLVQREQWWAIDRFERKAGGGSRPRSKLTSHADLLECAFGI